MARQIRQIALVLTMVAGTFAATFIGGSVAQTSAKQPLVSSNFTDYCGFGTYYFRIGGVYFKAVLVQEALNNIRIYDIYEYEPNYGTYAYIYTESHVCGYA